MVHSRPRAPGGEGGTGRLQWDGVVPVRGRGAGHQASPGPRRAVPCNPRAGVGSCNPNSHSWHGIAPNPFLATGSWPPIPTWHALTAFFLRAVRRVQYLIFPWRFLLVPSSATRDRPAYLSVRAPCALSRGGPPPKGDGTLAAGVPFRPLAGGPDHEAPPPPDMGPVPALHLPAMATHPQAYFFWSSTDSIPFPPL